MHHLDNLLEMDNELDDHQRLELKEQIGVLTAVDTPDKTRLAAGRFIKKVVLQAWNAALPVIQTVVAATILKDL